jgi:WD40 repeat protein
MEKVVKKVFLILLLVVSSLVIVSCEGKGKIIIEEPPNADVYINGKKVGKTPITLELREGKYNITVATAPFVEETKKNVQVYFDKTIVLKFNPSPKGILSADSIPPGAEVYDKREFLGTTPLKEKLNPGVHEIFFQKGKLSAVRKVNIEYQKETKLFVNLEKAVVHINVNPSDAVLIINGKKYTKFPLTLELEEGVHNIIVKKGIYEDRFSLKVRKGYELNISYELKPLQLPPVQAYGPIKFTNNGKYLVSMGKAGIYFWNINKFKPEISLWDPEDVRNFDKFINFGISNNDEFVVGIKPIRKLAYQFKDKKKKDKILIWDLKTTAVLSSRIYNIETVFATFTNDTSKIILLGKNGEIYLIDKSSGNLEEKENINSKITAFTEAKDFVVFADEKGFIYKLNKSSLDITKKKVFDLKVSAVALSKDEKYITVASSNMAKLLDATNLNTIKEKSFKDNITAMAISPSDKQIAVAFGKNVVVYDRQSEKQMYAINNLPAPIISMLFKDEEILITASGIKTPYVGIWKKGSLLKKWVQSIE